MKIYIESKKHIWSISLKEGIKKIRQPDWGRIRSNMDIILGFEEYKAIRERRSSDDLLTFHEAGAWRKREDMRLP